LRPSATVDLFRIPTHNFIEAGRLVENLGHLLAVLGSGSKAGNCSMADALTRVTNWRNRSPERHGGTGFS